MAERGGSVIENLAKKVVKIFTNEKDLILDCFAGSGTLAEVADELKRDSINIENDPDYFKIMKERLKNIKGVRNFKIKK